MTYSIVARDPETGELGVAVQSHYLSVGSVCPWARAGVGAVATQSMVDPAYGPLALELLAAGRRPDDALRGLVAADAEGDVRQVAVVSADGSVAAHTGARCIAEAGHRTGDGWSVQANMMRHATVPDAMAEAFTASGGDLVERMLAAFDAAEAAGGDIRGRQSAALLVVGGERASLPGLDRRWDLRVEDHPEPVDELRRLVALRRAYTARSETFHADEWHDRLAALAPLSRGNPELGFWVGVSLAEAGRTEDARAFLAPALAAGDGWAELLRRLPATGRLRGDDDLVRHLLGER